MVIRKVREKTHHNYFCRLGQSKVNCCTSHQTITSLLITATPQHAKTKAIKKKKKNETIPSYCWKLAQDMNQVIYTSTTSRGEQQK